MKRLPLLLFVPLGLAACSQMPPYSKPAVTTALAFKEAGTWKPAAVAMQSPEKWWQVFNDPTLNELEDTLIVDNQNIKLAEAQYRAARAAYDSARAPLFPTLGVSESSTRNRNATTSTSTVSTTSPVSNLHTLSAQASWEIDLWGQVRSGATAAGARLEASEAAVGAARLSAQALLAQSYFQLRAADAQHELLSRTRSAYDRFLEMTRKRFASGVASSLDVAQAEAQANTARTQLSDAELTRAQIEHAIAVLIGKAPADLTLSTAAALLPVPASPSLIPSVTLESRYDIYSAERQVAAANAQIGVAKAAYFPVLTLGATGGYRSAELATLTNASARFWSIGPALALTLFDGGARSAGVAQAEANYDQAVATYRQTVLSAFQEVEDNLVAIRLLGDESKSQQAALNAARRAREIAENQYRAGTIASLNVITAQTSELSAESTTIALWNRSMAATVQLYKNSAGIKSGTRQATE